jgi:hypothetical protein
MMLTYVCGYAEQVIIQVWISTHFGVISERLPVAEATLPFIDNSFTQRRLRCKAYLCVSKRFN